MLGSCSQLGTNSPVSRENSESNANGIMLFGVRVMEGSFRKCASMNNLAQFDHPQDSTAAGYASDDVVHPSARTRDRKRGVPWTEEEHKLFLLGLQKVGKGDWRGISRNFVKTRTPTQVASHAQKYFLRRNNHNNRRRRRSSLFDITTDTQFTSSTTEDVIFPVLPMASKMADLNLNHTTTTTTTDSLPLSLSLKVSVPGRQTSAYEGISGSFNSGSGDSIISVA